MSSVRWLNLLLWGFGDRLAEERDVRSDLLLIVDALLWIGLLVPALRLGPAYFVLYWTLAPAFGAPVYWVGTQLAVGYFMTRTKPNRENKERTLGPMPPPAEPAPKVTSEEP